VLCTTHADITDYYNPAKDPGAFKDPYFDMPDKEKILLSVDDGSSLSAKLRSLQSLQHMTHISVKLVGFDGDGNEGVSLDEVGWPQPLHSN
jgi:hypothetical protein